MAKQASTGRRARRLRLVLTSGEVPPETLASRAKRKQGGFEQERAWTGWSCIPCYAQAFRVVVDNSAR